MLPRCVLGLLASTEKLKAYVVIILKRCKSSDEALNLISVYAEIVKILDDDVFEIVDS